jgi:hypothetical protein
MNRYGDRAEVGPHRRIPGVDPSAALRLVAGVTLVALALTESFEAVPAALAAYASAFLILRGD